MAILLLFSDRYRAGDNSKLTVVTPDVGTEINAICDGTNWYLSGFAVSATVPAYADQ